MRRHSVFYNWLWQVDNVWLHLDGYVSDFERLDWNYEERPLFSKDGLIKSEPSIMPFRDRELKQIVKEYGGWELVTDPSFNPPEELCSKLQAIGSNRERFEHSRRYLRSPGIYRRQALDTKWRKREI